MKPEELAAYIGAAAWLPQVATWIYRAMVKPRLRVVPDQFAELSFTNYGPIFNVRMAFFVEHRDMIIDGVELTLRHQDGENRLFRWAGLGETFSQITDASGNQQIVGRDQSPIAIKVGTQALLERFVRFQEPRYHLADRQITEGLLESFNFLKRKTPDAFVPEVLASKEFYAVVEGRQKWFWWKPGRYEVVLKPSSPQKFKLAESSFAFELSSVDVDHLRRNIALIDTEVRNIISSNLPTFAPQPITWQWANVSMLRPRDA